MLEYLNFFLLCAIFALILYLYIQIKKYFPILKMAEELISNSGYETLQSDTKRQKLLECVLTGNSKLYLGKVYTEKQLAKLNKEEVEKLFNNYEAKLSKEALSEDLENDPFLNSALQRFTCRIVLQIRIVLCSLKHWNNYEQTLFI